MGGVRQSILRTRAVKKVEVLNNRALKYREQPRERYSSKRRLHWQHHGLRQSGQNMNPVRFNVDYLQEGICFFRSFLHTSGLSQSGLWFVWCPSSNTHIRAVIQLYYSFYLLASSAKVFEKLSSSLYVLFLPSVQPMPQAAEVPVLQKNRQNCCQSHCSIRKSQHPRGEEWSDAAQQSTGFFWVWTVLPYQGKGTLIRNTGAHISWDFGVICTEMRPSVMWNRPRLPRPRWEAERYR